MKLRIKGNSIRIRLLRNEVKSLVEKGHISEETRFSPDDTFYYAIIVSADVRAVGAKFENGRITVILPEEAVLHWAGGDDVGIETSQDVLNILIEKDFVCIGRPDDPDNLDAY